MTWRCFFGGDEQMRSRDDIFNTWRTHDMNGRRRQREKFILRCLTEKIIQTESQLFSIWFSIDPTC